MDNNNQFPQGSIIKLENEMQDFYSYLLASMIEQAQETKDEDLINEIRSLWDGESFERIIEKSEAEGSTWYVWWMDGVNALIRQECEVIEA
jgi:hypothetical protein